MVARPFKLHFILLCGVVGYEFSSRATQSSLYSHFILQLISLKDKLTLFLLLFKGELLPKESEVEEKEVFWNGVLPRERGLRPITHNIS